MDGAHHVLTAHVVVDGETDLDALTELRTEVAELCKEYRFAHTTVEIEWGDDACRMENGLTGT